MVNPSIRCSGSCHGNLAAQNGRVHFTTPNNCKQFPSSDNLHITKRCRTSSCLMPEYSRSCSSSSHSYDTLAQDENLLNSSRPTFSEPSASIPGKIVLEEHVSTDLFNAAFTAPYYNNTNELPTASRPTNSTSKNRTNATNLIERVRQMDTANIISTSVVFCVGYPFEDDLEIAGWFDRLEMNGDTKKKIAYGNSRTLFKLGL